MREKILVFTLFLLGGHATFADNDCWRYHQDHDRCRIAEGCEWVAENNTQQPCQLCEDGNYCPRNATSETGAFPCPEPFNHSTLGTVDSIDCYTPCYYDAENPDDSGNSDNYNNHTKNCGLTYGNYSYNNPAVSCINNEILTTWDTDETYHIEVLGGNNYGCYLNDRPCNLFSTEDNEGNDINAHDGITGNANWNDSYYNTDNCRYETSVSDFANRSCNADVTYKPNTNTTSVTENVIFNQLVSYYCTECTYDYFYPYSTTGPSFAGCINYNNFKVCSCKAIPQGHYRIIEWHAGISPENTYTACPAGKTTLTPYAGQHAGGVSIDDCKYGSETQLCDSVDCVNLSDLGAPESWTDL